jgi:hypothetical protein
MKVKKYGFHFKRIIRKVFDRDLTKAREIRVDRKRQQIEGRKDARN